MVKKRKFGVLGGTILLVIIVLVLCSKKIILKNNVKTLKNSMYSYVDDKYEINFLAAYDYIEVNIKSNSSESTSCEFSIDDNDKKNIEISNSKCNYTFDSLEEGKKYKININILNDQNETIKEITKEVNTITNLVTQIQSLKNWEDGIAQVYYHNGTLTTGAKDNSYRYSGKNEDIDNYVCFGSNEEKCSIDNLYRIIGAFDNDSDGKYNIKLITSDYVNEEILGKDGNRNKLSDFNNHPYYNGEKENIHSYYWLNPSEEINDWKDSDLNIVNLNTNYLNYIKDWQLLIDNNSWQVNGIGESQLKNKASDIYNNEFKNNENLYDAKIGLMYISDYMYSMSPKYWSKSSQEYNTYKEDNWLYLGANEWTITKNTEKNKEIFYVGDTGKISSFDGQKMFYAIRPNLYIKGGVGYIEGNGEKNTPYYIINTTPIIDYIEENHTSNSITITSNIKQIFTQKRTFYYSIDNGKEWKQVSSTDNKNSYTFTNLDANKEYTILIRVIDDKGIESEISKKVVKTNETLQNTIKSNFTGVQGENDIYYHDSTLENGAQDNSYRFSGANPNNYVCFGSDTVPCPTNNLYRIIGVFDNEVKLIKSEYATTEELGTGGNYVGQYNYTTTYYRGTNPSSSAASYYWIGTKGNPYNENYWKNSDLNKVNLNDYYLNTYLGEKWRNMIVDHTYQVSGYSETGSSLSEYVWTTVKDFYEHEIKQSTDTWNAKIGLMYVSDYGYAAKYDYWYQYIFDYNLDKGLSGNDLRNAINDNWMFMGLTEWSITRDTSITSSSGGGLSLTVLGPTWKGQVRASRMWKGLANMSNFAVRPVFYLNSNVLKYSGTGTKSDPYRLSQEISDPPTVSISSTSSTSSSITLTVSGTSGTNPIANYKYYLNGALRTTQSSNSYTFSSLAPYTTYTVSAEAVDSDGNVSKSVGSQVATKMLDETLKSTKVASSSGAYCYSCMDTSCKWAQGGTTVVVLWGDYYNMRRVNNDWYQVDDKWGDKGSDKNHVQCYVQACKISGSC